MVTQVADDLRVNANQLHRWASKTEQEVAGLVRSPHDVPNRNPRTVTVDVTRRHTRVDRATADGQAGRSHERA